MFFDTLFNYENCLIYSLLQSTRNNKIVWRIIDEYGNYDDNKDPNCAYQFMGEISGGYLAVGQKVNSVDFGNFISLVGAHDGLSRKTFHPDWDSCKEFWLLISFIKQQILIREEKNK